VARHIDHHRCELPTATEALEARQNAERGCDWAPHPDLGVHLDQALGAMDAPTRESLLALANREPLATVAARHGLSYEAVRQRVTRARKRLQPEFGTYRRGGR
jgi:DNA-directed RNA polymerase specialized sigma24 family protein